MAPRNPKSSEAPYLQIVLEIERRISSGQLRAGDRVPSIRQIAAEWGVAIATATKALTTLSQRGRVRAEPRIGSVVASPARISPSNPTSLKAAALRAELERADTDITRERVLQAAIEIADAEGLSALSMRGLAAKLLMPTMSLYRHVSSKEALVLLITDAAVGGGRAPAVTGTWRERLDAEARVLWNVYRKHPWLAQVIMLSRPLALPHVIAYADRALGALEGLGLDATGMMHVHITIYAYVQGLALNLVSMAQAEADSGISDDEWFQSQEASYAALLTSGRYPSFAKVLTELAGGFDLDLDVLFEFGLKRMLDGIESTVQRTQAGARE